jgi:hypothetical protein
MITPRLVFLAVVLALAGCGASSPPAPAPPAPSAASAASAAPAEPAELAGASRVDDEPAPGQRGAEASADGGAGPTQATIIAETKRVRDLVRGCVTEPGALRTGRVHVTLAPNGHADRVVISGHLKGTPEGGCVATGFRTYFHVAPFVGPPVTVKMSISLP